MAVMRTHRPIWHEAACRTCGACSRRCPASLFTEQALEPDSLRGRVARLSSLPRGLADQPPCQRACPLGQDVPGYIGALAAGEVDRALDIILQTNPLPSVLGWICSHPCTRACVRQKLDEAVEIKRLKLTAAVHGRRPQGLARPAADAKRVVVVGSGPAGLGAAHYLVRRGISVTLLDAAERPGGLLRDCLPAFDLPPEALAGDLDYLLQSGVEFEGGCRLGSAADIDALLGDGAQAVLLALGAGRLVPLEMAAGGQDGLVDALSFAREYGRGAGEPIDGPVVVAGGGRMAAACARMALRSGAPAVSLLLPQNKRMPTAEADGIGLAEEEGVQLVLGAGALEALGGERLDAVRSQTADGEREFPAAMLVNAGRRGPDLDWLGGQLDLDPRGFIKTDNQTGMTSRPGVFAAGEAQTGPRDVVRAMASGVKAAGAIERFLKAGGGS